MSIYGAGTFLLWAMVVPSMMVTQRLRKRVLAPIMRMTCEDLGRGANAVWISVVLVDYKFWCSFSPL